MGSALEELERLGLTVGTIVAVDDHPGARAPSYLLTVDLGSRGRKHASVPASHYDAKELLRRQVVCLVDEEDEAILVGAHSHAKGLVLLRPDADVENGTTVG